jgi:hypothetical protein
MRWPWSKPMDDQFFCGGCREWRPKAGAKARTLAAGEVLRCATCVQPMTADEGIELHEQLDVLTPAQLSDLFRNP